MRCAVYGSSVLTVAVQTFGSDASRSPAAGRFARSRRSAIVTVGGLPVPEPASLVFVGRRTCVTALLRLAESGSRMIWSLPA
jgi:hypothetical protein